MICAVVYVNNTLLLVVNTELIGVVSVLLADLCFKIGSFILVILKQWRRGTWAQDVTQVS